MTSEPVTLRERPSGRIVDDFLPSLIVSGGHGLCAGCGEPIALRSVVETIEDLALVTRSVAVFGIGCYTAFSGNFDVESLQALSIVLLAAPRSVTYCSTGRVSRNRCHGPARRGPARPQLTADRRMLHVQALLS